MKYTSVKKDPPTRPSSSPSPSSSSPSSKKEIGDYKIKHVNSLEVLRVNSEKTGSYAGALTEDLTDYSKPSTGN